MEPFFVLLAVAATLIAMATPVLAIIALVKARGLERRLRSVEHGLRQVRFEATPPVVRRPGQAGELPFEALPIEPEPPAGAQAPAPTTAREPSEASAATTEAGVSRATRPATTASQPRRAPIDRRSKPARPARKKIQWEQWVGVRGAAVLGGLVFALASLMFFVVAFERGWITPGMRIFIGAVVGMLAIGAGEVFRRREYRFAPAACAGGGIVTLYATTWASYQLYEFTSALAALPLMAAVTATCAWLSVRFRSQLVAVLGLVGGFATPILLSIHAEHPVGLFGYLLLLDIGLLALGQRMRWPSLGLFGMLGTFVVEMVWTFGHLDSNFFPLALGSLGAFALVFAAAGLRGPASERRRWFASQAGALLLPFAFATYFAALTDFGQALWPLAVLVGFLAVGASWIGSRQDAKWLVTGAAAGALAVSATWLTRTGVGDGRMWEYALSTLGMSLVFLGAERVFGRSPRDEQVSRWALPVSPAIVATGFAAMNVLAAVFYFDTSPWPWLLAALGQAVVLHVQGGAPRAGFLRLVGGASAGLCMGLHLNDALQTSLEGAASPLLGLGWAAASALLFLGLAIASSRREDFAAARWAWHAAVAFPLLLLVLLPERGVWIDRPGIALVAAVLLASLAVVPALVRAWSGWYLATLFFFLLRRGLWISVFLRDPEQAAIAGDIFLVEMAAIALLAAAPLLARERLGTRRLAWAGSGLLLCLALPNIDRLLAAHFEVASAWQAYASLGALAFVLAAAVRFTLAAGARALDSALRWMLGAGILLGSLAFTRYLDHEVLLVGLALTGLGLAALWRALPALGLKALVVGCLTSSALGLAALFLMGLAGNTHFEGGERLLFNWSSYAVGGPALCAVAAALLLGSRERQRLTNLEMRPPLRGRAWARATLGLVATLLAFIWINLQVAVYFEPGESLHLGRGYGQAYDLSLSICWILYALSLLAAGMARRVGGLRQISLAFLLLALAKVFLHDLGDLEGLYRVGSLFGLAISLLFVSLLYQRFVFLRRSGAGEAVEGGVL